MNRVAVDVTVVVARGNAKDVATTFRAGSRVTPIGVGTRGQWAIEGAGIAPVHFFLAYDNDMLFCASVAGVEPPRVNGVPVPTEWVRLDVPSAITFGDAELIVTTSPWAFAPTHVALSDVTHVMDPRRSIATRSSVRPDSNARSWSRNDLDGATLVGGMDQALIVALKPKSNELLGNTVIQPFDTAELEAAWRTAKAIRPNTSTLPTARPSQQLPPAQPVTREAPAPPVTSKAISGAVAYWRSAPPIRKAMIAILPLILAVSGAALGKTSRAASAPARGESPTEHVARPASNAGAQVASDAGTIGDTTSAALAAAPVPKNSATRERAAVDAVARGSFDEAARVYEEMATSSPRAEVFREAARIARRKATATE